MDNEEKLYNQAVIAQLVKIEKDIRKENESLLAIIIEMVEMNRVTLKALQMQSNIFINGDQLEREIDDEVGKLKSRISTHKNAAKEISDMLGLPAPSGNE